VEADVEVEAVAGEARCIWKSSMSHSHIYTITIYVICVSPVHPTPPPGHLRSEGPPPGTAATLLS